MTQNITEHRNSKIDACTTGRPRYKISQVVRNRIEEAIGWIKSVGGMAQRLLRGVRVDLMFHLKAAAYNLIRLPRLLVAG